MSMYDVIQYKLDRLINIMLNDGVQPGDIADNIFLDEYKQVSYKKCGDNIIGEIVISETIGNRESDYILRYFYDSNKRIMRIEEEKFGKVIVHWDRTSVETELINDIVDMLKVHYTETQMEQFVNTLPKDLSEKIMNLYYKVA